MREFVEHPECWLGDTDKLFPMTWSEVQEEMKNHDYKDKKERFRRAVNAILAKNGITLTVYYEWNPQAIERGFNDYRELYQFIQNKNGLTEEDLKGINFPQADADWLWKLENGKLYVYHRTQSTNRRGVCLDGTDRKPVKVWRRKTRLAVWVKPE